MGLEACVHETLLVAWAKGLLPPKDAPTLAAAVAGKADVLVTGDRRHFHDSFGRSLMGVEVLPPRKALGHVLSK